MTSYRPANTSMETNAKLGESISKVPVDKWRYQRLVGKLTYLSHTRPDISNIVTSQFMQNSYEEHMEAVERILRYLKSSPRKGLMFKSLGIETHTNSNWARSISDRRSTSEYCTFVARRSAEAEYREMGLRCEELWLKKVLTNLHQINAMPLKLYYDNKAVISRANNLVLHDQTKHVEIDRHFVKEQLDSGNICIPYIPTSQQIANVLTKGRPRQNFDSCIANLGVA